MESKSHDALKVGTLDREKHPVRRSNDLPHYERRRSDARQRVAEKWAKRIDQKSQQMRDDTYQKRQQHGHPEQSQEQINGVLATALPSVCFLIRNLWKDLLNEQSQQPTNQSQLKHERQVSKPTSFVRDQDVSRSRHNARASFPSVLSILQETALKQQVASFDMRNSSTKIGRRISSQSESSLLLTKDAQVQQKESASEAPSRLLSVLPANYDFSQAIMKMSQSRSRAFLLLDLAAIVKAHVYWRKLLHVTTVSRQSTSTKSAPFVQMVYNVQHNTNIQLLQLFQRLNVTCKVSTKYDLERLCDARVDSSMVQNETIENISATAAASMPPINNTFIMDNAFCPAKPNSFYRKLVLEQNVTTLAVDGPHEVVRLCNVLETMARRRQQNCPPLSFVLRLTERNAQKSARELANSTVVDAPHWKQLLKQTKAVIDALPEHALHGISVALPCWHGDDTVDCPDTSSPNIDAFCGTIYDVLKYMRDGLNCPCQQLDLTTTAVTTLAPTLIEWFSQIRQKNSFSNSLSCASAPPLVHQVTLDVSYLLVARAGALCTRIIGVKEQANVETSTCGEKGVRIGKMTVDGSAASMVHYYIDDGCYGSLYSETKDVTHIPLPLRRRHEDVTIRNGTQIISQKVGSAKADTLSNDTLTCSATVWGPTCDGLDKVCQDITLPKLARDDW